MSWLAEQDVLDWLGLDATGPVLSASVAASEALVETWSIPSPPPDWSLCQTSHPNVYNAAVRLAALTYQQTATPEGFAGFETTGGVLTPDYSQMVSLRLMARANAPKVG